MNENFISLEEEKRETEKYNKQMLMVFIFGPIMMILVFSYLFFDSNSEGINFSTNAVSTVAYLILILLITIVFTLVIRFWFKQSRLDQKFPFVGGNPPVILTNYDGVVRVGDRARIIIEQGAVSFTANPEKDDWFSTNHEKLLVDNARYRFLFLKTTGKVIIYSSRYRIENDSGYSIIGA